jgi:hypothetical protein
MILITIKELKYKYLKFIVCIRKNELYAIVMKEKLIILKINNLANFLLRISEYPFSNEYQIRIISDDSKKEKKKYK